MDEATAGIIVLSWWQLALSAGMVLILGIVLVLRRLGLAGTLLLASVRMSVQLWLVGLVLDLVFGLQHPLAIAGIALTMVVVAGYEIGARQRRPLTGWWRWLSGTGAAASSSLVITALLLLVVIQPAPWWNPHYAIPLLGMLLGNTMNGIALSADRLCNLAHEQRRGIEARLCAGMRGREALAEARREAWRTGLIPTINAMMIAGLVSLPGMMTGQILAGVAPSIAVGYQIMIFFAIAAGTGFGTLCAVEITTTRLLDERHRLRLDRLRGG